MCAAPRWARLALHEEQAALGMPSERGRPMGVPDTSRALVLGTAAAPAAQPALILPRGPVLSNRARASRRM